MRPFRLLPVSDEIKEAESARREPVVSERPFTSAMLDVPAARTSSLPGELPATPAARGPVTPVLPSTPVSLRDLMPAAVKVKDNVGRSLVIPAAAKSRKRELETRNRPARRLHPHLRSAIPLLMALLILGGTLLVWLPLSGGQSSFLLTPGFSNLLPFVPFAAQFQAHQSDQNTSSTPAAAGPSNNNLPHSQYVAMAEQDAIDVGISPTYFVRQINLESGFNPNAVSPGGAVGIAQFMPSTAAGLGIDPWNPVQALKAAAQMMANSYHTYGDYAKALAAYNAGSASLQRAVNSCGANWLSCMSPETQHYVAVIMGP